MWKVKEEILFCEKCKECPKCRHPSTYNVVQTLGSDCLVHLLVTIELISHGSEQTSSVLAHLLDQVALPPHDPLEPEVLVPPLLFSQVLAHVAVLVLTVVALLLLLLLLLLPGGDGAGDPGGAAGQGGGGSELILTQVMAGPLTGGSSVQRVVIVQLVVGGESLVSGLSGGRTGGAGPP